MSSASAKGSKDCRFWIVVIRSTSALLRLRAGKGGVRGGSGVEICRVECVARVLVVSSLRMRRVELSGGEVGQALVLGRPRLCRSSAAAFRYRSGRLSSMKTGRDLSRRPATCGIIGGSRTHAQIVSFASLLEWLFNIRTV